MKRRLTIQRGLLLGGALLLLPGVILILTRFRQEREEPPQRSDLAVTGRSEREDTQETAGTPSQSDHHAIDAKEASAVEEIGIRLERGSELRGKVVTAGGAPIDGAVVKLTLLDQAGPDSAITHTNERGVFSARNLRSGRYRVAAFSAGFRRGSVETSVPAVSPIQIELREDTGLVVLVTDEDGSPIEGAHVAVRNRTDGILGSHRSGLTDSSGTLRLTGLALDPREESSIEARHEGHAPWQETLSSDEIEQSRLEITLLRAFHVSGRVTDAAGQPVPDAEVRLEGSEKAREMTLRTTASGQFHFKNIPRGIYDIAAVTAARGSGRRTGIDVGPSGGNSGEVDILLEEGDGVVAGRVADEQGKGVALCPVSLKKVGDSRDSFAIRSVTDPSGHFRFAGLPSTTSTTPWDLIAGGGKLATVKLPVQPGVGEVVVVVLRLGSIRGIVALESGDSAYSIQLTRVGTGGEAPVERTFRFASRDARFRLKDVEPGTYTLTVLLDGTAAASVDDVQVRPGEETGPIEVGAR